MFLHNFGIMWKNWKLVCTPHIKFCTLCTKLCTFWVLWWTHLGLCLYLIPVDYSLTHFQLLGNRCQWCIQTFSSSNYLNIHFDWKVSFSQQDTYMEIYRKDTSVYQWQDFFYNQFWQNSNVYQLTNHPILWRHVKCTFMSTFRN